MPPVLPRKRLQSDSPSAEPPAKRSAAHPRRGNQSVFQALDAPRSTVTRSLSQTEALFGAEDDSSELSDPESSEDEFEDVVINGNGASGANSKGKRKAQDDTGNSESEEEDWEDALANHHANHDVEPIPEVSGDLNLNLSANPAPGAYSLKPDGKKGPTKIQRQIRNATHCMHVQFLMFHNLVRNSWIEDKQVQRILVKRLPSSCWREIDQYWRDAGIQHGHLGVVDGGYIPGNNTSPESRSKWKDAKTKGVKVYADPKSKKGAGNKSTPRQDKAKAKETKMDADRNQRDWGALSDRLEPNKPNLSAGDPLLRLLTYLSAHWKSQFKVQVPCLRKRGYLSPATLEAEIAAWKENPDDPDLFGERIESLKVFRDRAKKCEGSRDVGQQLFTALLRGLGIEARMVASLQPAGFGWSQPEEGKPKDLEKARAKSKKSKAAVPSKEQGNARRAGRSKDSPISVAEDDSSALSSAISISSDSDIEVPRAKQKTRTQPAPPYPTYWTEAISHLTHTPIAVCPGNHPQKSIIAPSSNPDALKDFYVRGGTADKFKQVFAYLIAFSSDGTAKDVTTRYLPSHQWPGRTKGFRMPVEKIPIHNKRGKVKKWEEFDWFKSVMRSYARSHTKRKPWDEIEDEGDLVPKKPAKPKDMDEDGGKETLQGYKSSAEYVLERHLRREEALKPGAKIVRYFMTGKGDKLQQEPVYRRKDIVNCKTVESWHKEGREVREGQQPLKYVPMRAVTVTRKREIEERERVEGEKVKQGLYGKSQTDWIIPDPIENGRIPRNAFGNIDVYVPTMIPKGAIHIPLKGTAKICRKLGIDYAEACTGFEFGKQRAVPVLTGVVVATENEDLVIDAWEVDEAAKAKKEHDKREALVLGMWKKFFVGLRIVHRMKREYGEDAELPAPELKKSTSGPKKSEWDTFQNHQDFEGGFLRDDPGPSTGAGGFLRDEDEDMAAGGFLPASQEEQFHEPAQLTIDHGEQEERRPSTFADTSHRVPISLHSALQNPVDSEDEDETHADDDQDNDSDSEPIKPPRTKQPSTTASRGRGRGRGAKQTPANRQPEHSDSDSDSDLDSPLSSLSSEEATTKPPKRRAHTPPSAPAPAATKPKTTPKRKAAQKSEENVKSHFFAHGSDEETDLTDRSPEKSGRGKGGARGRGRGRRGGRGRGRGKRKSE